MVTTTMNQMKTMQMRGKTKKIQRTVLTTTMMIQVTGTMFFGDNIMEMEMEEEAELNSGDILPSDEQLNGGGYEDDDDRCGHSSSSDNLFREE